MTVKELKDFLEGCDDEIPVIVYTSDGELVDAFAKTINVTESPGFYNTRTGQKAYEINKYGGTAKAVVLTVDVK